MTFLPLLLFVLQGGTEYWCHCKETTNYPIIQEKACITQAHIWEVVLQLYKTLMRPQLESLVQFWSLGSAIMDKTMIMGAPQGFVLSPLH